MGVQADATVIVGDQLGSQLIAAAQCRGLDVAVLAQLAQARQQAGRVAQLIIACQQDRQRHRRAEPRLVNRAEGQRDAAARLRVRLSAGECPHQTNSPPPEIGA